MKGKKSLPLFSENTHTWIYFVLLCILAAAMPTSRFVMSLSQLLMGANWLLEGNYREKFQRFKSNKAAITFLSLFSIYVVALLWTEDLRYALGKNLVDKLPMLTLTFMVASSKPIRSWQVYLLAYVFFASVLVTSFIGFYVFITESYTNFRHVSPYISHVYLSMMICMTIGMLPWLTHKLTEDYRLRILAWVVVAWLIVFLFILNSFTGLICFGGMILFLFIRFSHRIKSLWIKASIVSLFLAAIISGVYLISSMYQLVSKTIEVPKESLSEKSAEGNAYTHSLSNPMRENGHYVYRFIADSELREKWNQLSEKEYNGKDVRGNLIRDNVLRYLSSKGERKDKEALSRLEEEEIRAIERGVTNYLYLEWPGVQTRLHQTVWEIYWYREMGDPTGFSFAQRLEFWQASWIAFKEKPILGWGTGDIFIAMYYGLESIDSPLDNYHFKPHNQYLLFLNTFGVLGAILFFLIYWRYVMLSKVWKYLPFNLFLVIMLVSMLANNPIDAQAGQTFFTFFTLYFGVLYPWKLINNPDNNHTNNKE